MKIADLARAAEVYAHLAIDVCTQEKPVVARPYDVASGHC
jgi:hypothetical protein